MTFDIDGTPNGAGRRPLTFSIVTVVRNDRSGLEATLQSVRQQSYSRIEHIVIDGASTDGTVEVLRRHSDRLAFWRSEPDAGLYDAMNKGLRRCHGDYCVFLNAGDRLLRPDGLERVAESVTDRQRAYFTQARLVDPRSGIERLVPPAGIDIDRWLAERTPNHQSVFFPCAYYARNDYDTSYTINADGDYMLRCFESQGVGYLPILNVEFALGGMSNRYADLEAVGRWVADRRRLYQRYYPNKRFKFLKSTVRPYLIFGIKRLVGQRYLPLMRALGRYQ